MTLFEALAALVILGLTATGILGVFQATSRSTQSAEAWVQAVSYAEATMEQTKLGTAADGGMPATAGEPGFTREIDVRPWAGVRGVEQVTVTVMLPDGRAFVLRRLVRAP